ncbi:UbiH/UbiF family hydroxylase [Roseibium sp. TrichSKD4]|uniref:UbiH/UbiF family hydroxylase n=1 Tax=Roseibium sp. TrichSKD4 TaxID=744980 RepID=UPI00058F8845|nr:UbiH/UbiF family hydroxylase [Roseibium sp. TrichSKD4]
MSKTEQNIPVHDVAVIGGGPSGLTAAILLAQAGLSTLIVTPPVNVTDGRTTALWHDSINMMEKAGIWENLKPKTSEISRLRMIDDTGRLIRAPEVTFESAEIDLEAFGYNILNKDLNAALDEKARETENLIIVHDLADQYDLTESHIQVTTEAGETYRAKLAVAADGRNSKLRDKAEIKIDRWSYSQVAVVLNLSHDRPHNHVSTEFHKKTGPCALVPLTGRNSSIVCVETPEGALRLGEMGDEQLAAELERRVHSIYGKLKVTTKRQMFPLAGMMAKTFAANRVMLIGETAHVFPPIGAQGLNLSLRDVASLLEVVSLAESRGEDIGGATAMTAYDKKRQPDIVTRTNAVHALNRSLLSELLPVQLARSAGLQFASKVSPFRKLLMKEGVSPRLSGMIPVPFR